MRCGGANYCNLNLQSRKVLVEGAYHGNLHEVAPEKHLQDFLFGEGVDLDVLGGIKMLSGGQLHAYGEVAMGDVVHGAGELHDFAPLAAGVTSLFLQFAFGGVHRVFAGFHAACHEFEAGAAEAVAVLADDDHLAVAGDGDDVDPGRVLEDVVFVVNAAVGQLADITAGGEPGAAEEVFRGEGFPVEVLH